MLNTSHFKMQGTFPSPFRFNVEQRYLISPLRDSFRAMLAPPRRVERMAYRSRRSAAANRVIKMTYVSTC